MIDGTGPVDDCIDKQTADSTWLGWMIWLVEGYYWQGVTYYN
jgi:hypothetical protein